MRYMMLSILTALSVLGFVARAAAQPDKADARHTFEAFITSPPYLDSLTKLMNESEPPSLKASCPALKIIAAKRYLMLSPVTFKTVDGVTRVSGGSWISLVKADRCGAQVTRRFLFVYRPAIGKVEPIRLLPGDFRAGLQTEAVARKMAAKEIETATDCRDPHKIYILDIKGDGAIVAENWKETWSAEGCGRPVTLHVTYTKGPKGLTIHMTTPKPAGKGQ